MQSITGIILAAGQGKRMGSLLPKVLHPVGGKPMLEYVLEALLAVGLKRVSLVIGPDEAPFHSFLEQYKDIAVCIQKDRNGTAGAAASCAPLFPEASISAYAPPLLRRGTPETSEYVLICNGDTPGISGEALLGFIQTAQKETADLALLGFSPPSPYGYGRILCGPNGRFQRIVEEKDASAEEKAQTLCNTGIVFARTQVLFSLLAKLHNRNAQQEYYLTDCFALAVKENFQVSAVASRLWQPFLGVNTPQQLDTVRAYLKV
jgi:bifunctional UDP-N-acetylglucosamine pyrophosphorylase/glucosamine-1-phosphate N-acetyltransferase